MHIALHDLSKEGPHYDCMNPEEVRKIVIISNDFRYINGYKLNLFGYLGACEGLDLLFVHIKSAPEWKIGIQTLMQ